MAWWIDMCHCVLLATHLPPLKSIPKFVMEAFCWKDQRWLISLRCNDDIIKVVLFTNSRETEYVTQIVLCFHNLSNCPLMIKVKEQKYQSSAPYKNKPFDI